MSSVLVRRLRLALFALPFLLALVALLWWTGRAKPVSVVLKEIDLGRVESSIANTRAGTVEACLRTKLSTIMGGRIEQLAVKEGEHVKKGQLLLKLWNDCLLYTSPSPRDRQKSRMPSSA